MRYTAITVQQIAPGMCDFSNFSSLMAEREYLLVYTARHRVRDQRVRSSVDYWVTMPQTRLRSNLLKREFFRIPAR